MSQDRDVPQYQDTRHNPIQNLPENNCQRLLEDVCSTSIINRRKWLRDIINNSKLFISSSPQPSLSILVYRFQEIDSLAIKCVKTTCQLSGFLEAGKISPDRYREKQQHSGPTSHLLPQVWLCGHTPTSLGLEN